MRVSIPSLPRGPGVPPTVHSVAAAVDCVAGLLRSHRRPLVITGAGVSVESGISSYRGADGLYVNSGYRPIYFHEFLQRTRASDKRCRYWARSFLGYPALRLAQPNATHYALAELLRAGHVAEVVTQNVDRLHHVAAVARGVSPQASTVEIHGSLSEVRCAVRGDTPRGAHPADPETAWWDVSRTAAFGPVDRYYTDNVHAADLPEGCGFVLARDALQDRFVELNPAWTEFRRQIEAQPARALRRNPDGDIQLEGADYGSFRYPACPNCGGVLKPDVVFFGESVRRSVRTAAERAVDACDAVLVVGTSVATHSVFRLLKQAAADRKPIVLLNLGPTRADALTDTRIGLSCSDVLPKVAQQLAGSEAGPR
ncbi:hypothetical protein MSPP1_003236 [Malassezia sp. CBS 17886]|nr:hypothetical protein MSPP1_003236 [Malassezia sp. CBS 17886]